MDEMFNLLQAVFSTIADTWHGSKWDVRSLIKAQDEKSISSATSVNGNDSDPYAGDIYKLQNALFNGHPMESGTCIDITLQDILQIIPKKRRRVDAYRGLVSRLGRMGVTLTINSQKRRRDDSKFEKR